MVASQPAEDAIRRIEAVRAKLGAVAARSDDQRLKDLVQHRLELSKHFAELPAVVEPVLAARGGLDLVRRFQTEFSRTRTTLALHHADWPAVSVKTRSAEYSTSVQAAAKSFTDLVEWLRVNL